MKDRNHTIGQDSFLDIVANLVGILIILIMVVGAHAQSEWLNRQPNESVWQEVDNLANEVKLTSRVSHSLQLENHEFEAKIASQANFAMELDQKRHEMLVQLTLAKNELEKKEQVYSAKRKRQLELVSKKTTLEQRIQRTRKQLTAIDAAEASTRIETIEHYPTPIAKTVFAEEVHFLLSQGTIAYIPMDELIEKNEIGMAC